MYIEGEGKNPKPETAYHARHGEKENSMNTKMTMKAFLTAVLATEGITAEVAEFATAEIAKIEGKNAKRRNTPTKAQQDNAGLLEFVLAGMTAETVVTASEVAKMIGESTQKASAILQMGVKSGALTSTEVKGKSGKVKGYALTK